MTVKDFRSGYCSDLWVPHQRQDIGSRGLSETGVVIQFCYHFQGAFDRRVRCRTEESIVDPQTPIEVSRGGTCDDLRRDTVRLLRK